MQRYDVIVVAMALVMAACGREEAAEPPGPPGVPVTVATVRVDALRDVVTAAGRIVPSIGADFTVTAPEAAMIREIPRGEGALVAAGDLLVRLEIASLVQELAARQLDLADATSRLSKAKNEMVRLQTLHDKGLLPRVQYEAGRADLTSVESVVSHATAQLAAVTSQEERQIVRSRFAGIITKVWRAVGDSVVGGPSDPILRLIDPSRVQISILLPLGEVARVSPGFKATVQTGGGAPLEAVVATRTTPADASAQTVDVRLNTTVPLALPIDTPVQTEILVDERKAALVVPVAALLRDASGSYVYVAGDDNKAHRRDVRVGLSTRTMADVISGLAAGDRVIVTGVADLSDGADIVVNRAAASGG